MSFPTRVLIVTFLALLGGTLFQSWLLAGQNRERDAAARQLVDAQQRILDWQQERQRAEARRAALEKEISEEAAETTTRARDDAGLTGWLLRVERLKDWLQQNPARRIPEMQFLNSNDWLSATFDNRLETDAQIRLALRKLRTLAKAKPEISANLSQALQAYARAHNGEPITALAQLRAYLQPSLGEDILSRYALVPEIPGVNDRDGVNRDGARFRGAGRIIFEEQAIPDADYDTRLIFMEQGAGSVTVSGIGRAVDQATTAFIKANPGRAVSGPELLLPYLNPPVDEQALREYWEVKDRR
jgi:hypothetical protein